MGIARTLKYAGLNVSGWGVLPDEEDNFITEREDAELEEVCGRVKLRDLEARILVVDEAAKKIFIERADGRATLGFEDVESIEFREPDNITVLRSTAIGTYIRVWGGFNKSDTRECIQGHMSVLDSTAGKVKLTLDGRTEEVVIDKIWDIEFGYTAPGSGQAVNSDRVFNPADGSWNAKKYQEY